MQTITQLLDQLAELQSALDMLELQRQELIDNAMPPEVRQAIIDINAEFGEQEDAAKEKIAALETRIKAAALDCGETVNGNHLQAVYVKGRVTWDSKKLDGLMIVLPDLAGARNVGAPSVQIRKRGKA